MHRAVVVQLLHQMPELAFYHSLQPRLGVAPRFWDPPGPGHAGLSQIVSRVEGLI